MMNTTRFDSKKKLWAVVALVLSFAMLICVAFPGLQVVAEDLELGSGSGSYTEASEVSPEVLEVYEDGVILLRSYEQLAKVGTGAALKTADGTQVYDEAGYAVTYALDATYAVAEDIAVPAGKVWCVPSGFTGRIAPVGDSSSDDTDEPATAAEVEKAIAAAEKDADSNPMYDADANAILVYNPYQLVTMSKDDAAEQPVMSLDFNAATYGMGELVYGSDAVTDGDASAGYLTYSPNNNYIITTKFDSATPTLLSELLLTLESEEEEETSQVAMSEVKATLKAAKAPALAAASTTDLIQGRDYFGQEVITVGSVKYILLGSYQQLQALDDYTKTKVGGSDVDADVNGPIWYAKVKDTASGLTDVWTIQGDPLLVYPGDADLNTGVTVYDKNGANPTTATDMKLGYLADGKTKITDLDSDYLSGTLTKTVYIGADAEGNPSVNVRYGHESSTQGEISTSSGLTYSPNNNYIVFRDIEVPSTDDNSNWTPLMFYGTMYGCELSGTGTIATATAENGIDDLTGRPVISNIIVNESDQIDLDKFIGFGFFATLKENTSVGSSSIIKDPVVVKNIELQDVSITNTSTEVKDNNTLVNALTEFLGDVVGKVLNALLAVLSLGENVPNLDGALSDLLNARRTDVTNFATGSFAGRVEGNVTIDNCVVSNTTVTAEEKGYVGGFIGYSTGVTEYDALSKALDKVVDSLAKILNVIPWLGLGDLVTILLGNAVTASKLIPTSYTQPVISNCNLNNLTGSLGSATTNFIGGFIGDQVGTRIEHSSITDSTVNVKASTYGGGFAGLTRDGKVEGLLNQLGLDLLNYIRPQSVLYDCAINYTNGGTTTVSVTGDNLLGGFVGAQTESYAVNSVLKASTVTVTGTDSYVGGFCGYSTLGWVSNLGANERGNTSLLSTVTELLTGLLSSNSSTNEMLLSLAGVSPSAIMGLQMEADTITVEAGNDYAGGILGRGDGVYLTPSSKDYLDNLTFWTNDEEEVKEGEGSASTVTIFKVTPIYTNTPEMNITVKGLNSVKAGGSYAGGIAGAVNTANVAGLLNGTLGVGGFLGFHIEDVHITGTDGGFTVLAGVDCAAGGIGESIGGEITNCSVKELKSVTAGSNYAGGFIGRAGPGTLVNSEGLSLNLLGLNKLANVSNLLSVGAAIHTSIDKATVQGIDSGFAVEAKGTDSAYEYMASGFIAQANSIDVHDSHVTNLNYVKANNTTGITGGFVGKSATGDLANIADKNSITSLIKVDGGLLNAVSYMIPQYILCDVTYVNGGYVESAVAGGFTGDFQSGFVNYYSEDENKLTDEQKADLLAAEETPWAVYNIDAVNAQYYGGGFGGKVYSGALADGGKGISILGDSGLSIQLSDLLSVANAYVPIIYYAGVYSANGFTVTATQLKDLDDTSGAAGGYIGFASGAQISYSDVWKLKHTVVTPPDDLEAVNAPSYYDSTLSSYAVTGGRYAGGYVGLANVGSAASVSGGLAALDSAIKLSSLLSALNVVVTTIEHSDVTGATGGFAVMATQTESLSGKVGDAGGFAGALTGAHIQDSNSYNFSYIIGEISAGGYVGNFVPGSIADAVGSLELLKGLAVISTDFLSLGRDFVASIRNSETTCIPCGGAVRANSPSDKDVQRGMAGGYVGHNEGGQIWGWNDDEWKDENVEQQREGDLIKHKYYTGTQRECAAIRILSVYGYEFAGGFTGLMEAANTAQAGGLSLLGGLLSVDNIIGALAVAYPTEENTAVYGPLAKMDISIWKSWVQYVGQYGGFGKEFRDLVLNDNINTQEELDEALKEFVYGFNVVAGRPNYSTGTIVSEGGAAGGYVGRVKSGVITNGQSHHVRKVSAMRTAGGFAGEALVGGAAEFGSISALGFIDLNIGGLLPSLLDVFVPVIKNSSVAGYKSGLTVTATGNGQSDNVKYDLGHAGGYIGKGAGAQLWGDAETDRNSNGGDNVKNLLEVRAPYTAGGYAGSLVSGSTLAADTNNASNSGILSTLLSKLISTPSSLASVLDATVSTVRNAHVTASTSDWGYTVYGTDEAYAHFAGGYVGLSEATIFGDKDLTDADPVSVSATNLRGVNGGAYAGGFFGLADINGVANIAEDKTAIAGLINAGGVSVIDAFKTYVYHGAVTGVAGDGYTVRANTEERSGLMDSTRYTGCAGGFGGALMNGKVTYSTATNLNAVTGLNYNGGFVGHMGKSGIVTVDDADIGTDETVMKDSTILKNLLGADISVLNIFGAHAENCSVTGIASGYTVSSHNGTEPIAAGFAAYADLSRILNCTADKLKYVSSDGIAGGFVGVTTMAYLASIEVNGKITELVVNLVQALVEILLLNDLEKLDLINIGDNTKASIFGLKLLSDGQLLYVNLLGLKIGVSVGSVDETTGKVKTVNVTIGDSSISLPVSDEGKVENLDNQNIQIDLVKGNRTKVVSSTVTGVAAGYDVYGGGADYYNDGTATNPYTDVYTRGGYAGGFVGFNKEGKIQDSHMVLCDTIRGTPNYVGVFSGASAITSVYPSQNLEEMEGEEDSAWNTYKVYRSETVTTINHMQTYKTYSQWEGDPLNVYISNAKAVLMNDTPLTANIDSETGRPTDMQDPCIETVDLTITKIWKDRMNLNQKRPESITIHLYQQAVEYNSDTGEYEAVGDPTELKPDTPADADGYTLTADDANTWTKSVWQILVEGLPASTATTAEIKSGATPSTYYVYYVTEEAVDEYVTEITVEEAVREITVNEDTVETGYKFTVTNRLSAKLPSTGGRGVATIIILGCLIVALGMLVKVWREDEENGGEAID